MDIKSTFKFKDEEVFKVVWEQLNDSPATIQSFDKNCITIWGNKYIEVLRESLKGTDFKYEEVNILSDEEGDKE